MITFDENGFLHPYEVIEMSLDKEGCFGYSAPKRYYSIKSLKMDSIHYNTALSIIEEMKKFEEMKVLWSKKQPDLVAEFMVTQCQDSKNDLLRQLMATLLKSGLNLKNFEYFFLNAFAYLQKTEPKKLSDERLKSNLAEVEKILTA